MPSLRSGRRRLLPAVHWVCRTSDLEIGWGYAKQIEIVGGDCSTSREPLGLSEGPVSIRGDVMSQQVARRSALGAQAVLRKRRADQDHRLEGLAIEVLTALGERDAAVRDTERRAGKALQTMTIEEACRCERGSAGAALAA
jgi:hypothetical protein